MFSYSWNSLYLPFKYGWVFDSFKSSANGTPSSTGHLLRALLHEYLGWGKTLFPQSTLPKKKNDKKKLKEKLKAASLTWLLAKLPGCVKWTQEDVTVGLLWQSTDIFTPYGGSSWDHTPEDVLGSDAACRPAAAENLLWLMSRIAKRKQDLTVPWY